MMLVGVVKIDIKGSIVSDEDKWVYDWLGITAVCPKDVVSVIDSLNGEDLEVYINSGGGDVFAGVEIYSAIRAYSGNVVIFCVGLAGSAASVILMAGYSEISPSGMVMIHNASSVARGDYHEMDFTSDVLVKVDNAICNAYIDKTNMARDDLLALMDKTTWLIADEAIDLGFVDGVMQSKNKEANSAVNDYIFYNNSSLFLDKVVIDKFRNSIKNPVGSDFIGERVNMSNNISSVEELSAKYPELVSALIDSVKTDAISSERERIKAIDDIASSVPADIVFDAKFVNAVSASEMAFNVLKANKKAGKLVFDNMVNGIVNSGSEMVTTDANSGYTDNEQKQAKIRIFADKLKALRE